MTRILVIDDDPLFGNALVREANARGIDVDFFGSLIDALYATYLDRYDVAIVDCVMPEVCRNFAPRMSSSGRCSGRMRLAAEPARR